MEALSIRLYAKIFLQFDIRLLSGLHIGGTGTALEIGGLDNTVIRDPIRDQPYIPGSSLRGKMRSLWEKFNESSQNQVIQKGSVYIHGFPDGYTGKEAIEDEDARLRYHQAFEADRVLRIFGSVADKGSPVPNPTRLIVQDSFLSEDSINRLNSANTDQPYTETKTEAVIDRVTSAAVPRQIERVPADSVFEKAQLIYSVFGARNPQDYGEDIDWFQDVLAMLLLVEEDYIGGSGSRGSGRIRFENLRLYVRLMDDSLTRVDFEQMNEIQQMYEMRGVVIDWLYNQIFPETAS